jgi:cell division protein FtsW (lipid II flippase)/cell division protein FtsI/penicillin-binding protein 2
MNTQPIQKARRRLNPRVITVGLMVLAALFVLTGAATLHFAAPTPALTTRHLIKLVGGWALAWSAGLFILQTRAPHADPFIPPIVALLTGWGLLLIARLAPRFLERQILWLFIGVGAMCATALLSPLARWLRRYRYTLLTAGLILLGATFIFGVNPSGQGQRLWLGAPFGGGLGVYFQPSEPLKLLFIIYLAAYLSERRALWQESTSKAAPVNHATPMWLAVVGPLLTMVGISLLLLGWQQDLGAAMLFYLTFVTMLYLAWGKLWPVILGLCLFAPVMIAGILFSSRVALRVSIWLDPWAPEQADRAFQILQSLYALAGGGVIGQGLGQGTPTLIPAVHTDFVYAALVEEFGLIGAVALIALFAVLIYRGLRLAQNATSPFESLLAGGITTMLGLQTWVILGGNAKLIPITGVTLPYLSYGGSSMLLMMITTGLLLNLSAPHPPPLSLSPPRNATPPLRQTAGRLGMALLTMLTITALFTGTWSVLQAEELRARPTNPRTILSEARIRRGRILDQTGTVLAGTEIDARGYVTRTYPVPAAAPVVGYTTLQYGAAGIEATCDARLRGDLEQSPEAAFWDALLHQPPVGEDVRLTLEAELQKMAQTLLQGHEGAAILVDAHTGAILALASTPTYDPATVAEKWATLREAPDAPLLNRATQGLAQPGPILETVLLSAALDAGLPPTSTPESLTRPIPINGNTLRCTHPPTETTWTAALAQTCPGPFAALTDAWDAEQLKMTFETWRLTTAPALEIPTVATTWETDTSSLDVVAESLGQGELLVTPLQLVNVAATLGNDGLRPALHLLPTSLDSEREGCDVPARPPIKRLLSAEDAAVLRTLWPTFDAAIGHQGQALAGPERTVSWFIGLNSAVVPRYAVAVMVENPVTPQTTANIGTELLRAAVGPRRSGATSAASSHPISDQESQFGFDKDKF